MFDHHPLGTAGGARGVDHIGQATHPGGLGQVFARLRRDVHGLGIDQHRPRGIDRQCIAKRGLGQPQGGAAVLQHRRQSRHRVARVHRHVSGAGFQHRQHRHDHVDATLQVHRHRHVLTSAGSAQVARQAVGTGIQFGIGQCVPVEAQGWRVGSAARLGLDTARERLGGQRRLGRLPASAQLAVFGVVEQVHLTGQHRRVSDHGARQHQELSGQSLHGRRQEQVGGVVPGQSGRAAIVFKPQADVEFALALRKVDRIVAPGLACDACDVAVEDGLGEQRLEQRVAAQVALRLQRRDQLLERQLGMIEGARDGVANPRQYDVKADVTADLGAQHQAVQEQALHIGQLGPVAAGHRCANDHVGLAGVARQQALEQRQQRHEHRGLVVLRQGPQALGQRRGQRHGDRRTAATGHRRARQIGVQIQHHGHAGQLRAPPAQLFGQHGALQPGTLPDRVVGILDRQFRQPGFATGLRRGAQFAQLSDQPIDRPAVGGDMVDRHAQCAAPTRQAEQQRPPHTTGQVEGLPALGTETWQRGGGEALVGHLAQVDHWQRLPGRRLHPLVRPACAHVIGGSQHLVAVDQRLDGLRQHLGRRIDDGAQLQVERTAPRVELMQEPHPLLVE